MLVQLAFRNLVGKFAELASTVLSLRVFVDKCLSTHTTGLEASDSQLQSPTVQAFATALFEYLRVNLLFHCLSA